jgi:hypothetical protein
VDEVVGRVDAVHCRVQRGGVENFAPDNLRGFLDTVPHLVGVSGQTPQDHRLPFEERDQPTATFERGSETGSRSVFPRLRSCP